MSAVRLDLPECAEIPFDRREILRYMGCREGSEATDKLIASCIEECRRVLCYRTVFLKLDASAVGSAVTLGGVGVESAALSEKLSGCESAIVFGATVGMELDRLILKHGHLSPSRATALQAIGAERIELLCEELCKRLAQMYGSLCPRFSPGYGDLPLSFQKDIFSLLECHKHIGLTLNGSLLMSPTKSVTAIVGIK